MNQVDEDIVKVYDDVLAKFPHISSLCIERENFEELIKNVDSKNTNFDKDIARAHQCFIADVITTAATSGFAEAKQAIMYPKFKAKTYVPNPYYYFKDNYSLEKTVMMLKKYVLNLVINDDECKLDPSSQVLNVLQIEKIDIEPMCSFYTLKRCVIGLNMFYNLYNRVVLKYRGFGMPKEGEMVYLNNVAIDQGFLVMEPFEMIDDGKFVINSTDYSTFKKYIKDKYRIDFNDECLMPNGEENTVWLCKDIEKYDNRPLVEIGGKEEILPLTYQRNLKKLKKY